MTIAWINKMNRKAIQKKGEELKDMQGMKEWKHMIFLVILYGSCLSNNMRVGIVILATPLLDWIQELLE